jgi:ribosome-binding factor A
VPALRFKYDASVDKAERIDHVLRGEGGSEHPAA